MTPSLTTEAALISLLSFVVAYTIIYGAGTYYLVRLLRIGPTHVHDAPQPPEAQRPKRPLSATDQSIEPAE